MVALTWETVLVRVLLWHSVYRLHMLVRPLSLATNVLIGLSRSCLASHQLDCVEEVRLLLHSHLLELHHQVCTHDGYHPVGANCVLQCLP